MAVRSISLAVGMLLALSGCASVGGRADAASSVAVGLLSAVDAGNGASACAVLAPDTAAELEKSAGKPCPEAILDEDLPATGRVIGADVYGQWAQVRLDDDTIFLAAFEDGWRVVAAGCQSRDPRPYDCALDGG